MGSLAKKAKEDQGRRRWRRKEEDNSLAWLVGDGLVRLPPCSCPSLRQGRTPSGATRRQQKVSGNNHMCWGEWREHY